MKFQRLWSFVVLITILAIGLPVKAQIQLGGLADFEIRKGGSDSSPYVNQTPWDKWSVYTPSIRLFVNADISENWFINSALQADYYNSRKLSDLFFSVININWMPIDDSEFTATIGRFVTPYGAYSKRVLSSDNPFVHLPLSHASGLPVNRYIGILADDVEYSENITGLTMVYQRMYSQGIRIENQVGESGRFGYNLAATLAPATGHFDSGQYNTPSFTGRLTLQPAIWSEFGFSFSTGPFMRRDLFEASFIDSDPSSYRQTLLGTDLSISYRYFTILAEYNWSRWKAPYISQLSGAVDEDMEASINHLSGEAVVNFPFFVGGYAGIRLEQLFSSEIGSGSGVYNTGDTWTYDRNRIEFLAGYKLHRNITMKISYLYGTDSGPGLDADVFAIQLSASY